MTIYKRHCNTCGKYYESQGKYYCSKKCKPSGFKDKHHKQSSKDKISESHLGIVSWCKGLTKENDERIRKLGEKSGKNRKGKPCSNGFKKGYKAWNKDKPMSESTKLKMSKASKGKPKSESHKNNISKFMRSDANPMKDPDVVAKRSGANHHSFKDWASRKPYCYLFNNSFKEDIRSRDSRICQLCNKTEVQNGEKLCVHHIHGDKDNCYPDCIALCRHCNMHKVEKKGKEKYYEDLLMNNLNNRSLLF